MNKSNLFNKWLLLALLLLGVSCVKDDVQVEPLPANDPHHVSYERALVELQGFMDYLDGEPLSRSSQPKRVIANHYTKSFDATSRSAEEYVPDIYIVNFENQQGFAILSTDDRMPPVLALTESGSMIEGAPIENPGVEIFMTNLASMPLVDEVPKEPGIDDDDGSYGGSPYDIVYTPWVTDTYGSVIPARWGQEYPYNAKVYPNKTGCAATAVAQVMYYHKYPPVYHHSSSESYSFDWNEIVKHKVFNYGNTSDDYVFAYDDIAQLILQLGRSRNLSMSYGEKTSGSERTNMPKTFVHFGYSSGSHHRDYSFSTVKASLAEGSPVLISGYGERTIILGITFDYDKSHTWVIDAAMQQTRTVYYYQNNFLAKTETEERKLLHCNWGWDGDCNGYFYSAAFDTRSPEQYDGIYNITDYHARYKVEILPYVHP